MIYFNSLIFGNERNKRNKNRNEIDLLYSRCDDDDNNDDDDDDDDDDEMTMIKLITIITSISIRNSGDNNTYAKHDIFADDDDGSMFLSVSTDCTKP